MNEGVISNELLLSLLLGNQWRLLEVTAPGQNYIWYHLMLDSTEFPGRVGHTATVECLSRTPSKRNCSLFFFFPFKENHKLRDQNDDLNAQILSLSLYEAKNLFACQTKAQCLAAEIDNASRDEVSLLLLLVAH